jgi:hypothetical protein
MQSFREQGWRSVHAPLTIAWSDALGDARVFHGLPPFREFGVARSARDCQAVAVP